MQLGVGQSNLGCHGASGRPCRRPPIKVKEIGSCQASVHDQSPVQRPVGTAAVLSAASDSDSEAGPDAEATLNQKLKPERRKRMSPATLSIDGGACDLSASVASMSTGDSLDVKSVWPIMLQEHVFNCREEIFQLFAIILKAAQLGQPLSLSDQRLVVQLLKVAHPRACEKIGMGVRRVTVEAHVMFPGVRNFVVHRGDGSHDNFSYRKCINNLTGCGWTLATPPLITLQHQANKTFVHNVRADVRALEVADPTLRPWESSPQACALSQYDAQEREYLIDHVFSEFDLLGPQGPSVALLAISVLATCVRYDTRRARALVQEFRFLKLEAHLTPQGAKDLIRSHHSYLNVILNVLRQLQYVPSTGLLDGVADVAKQRLRRMNCSELSLMARCYANMAKKYVPPGELLRALSRRFIHLLTRSSDVPAAATLYHAMVLMEPLPPNDQRILIHHVIEGRDQCTPGELSLVVLALGIAQNAPVIESREVNLLVDTILSKLESIDECVQSVATVPPAAPLVAQALPIQRMLSGLQCMQHRPSPRQLLHICSLLEAHGTALYSPNEVLTSLASLGVAPLSAHSGPGVVDALIAGARSRLTSSARHAKAALSTAWALAVLQRGDVAGFRDIWDAACTGFKGEDHLQGCKLYHTAILVHFEVPHARDVLVGRRVMEWAQHLWLGVLRTHVVSDLHRQVAAVLTALGLHYVVEYLTTDGLQSIDLVLRPPPSPQQQQWARALRRPKQPRISSWQEQATTHAASSSNSNGLGDSTFVSVPAATPARQVPTSAVPQAGQAHARLARVSMDEEGSPVVSPPTAATATLATDVALHWEPSTAAAAFEDGGGLLFEERLARRPEWRQSDPLELLDRPQWPTEPSVDDDDDDDLGGSVHLIKSVAAVAADRGTSLDMWGSGSDKRGVWTLPSAPHLAEPSSSSDREGQGGGRADVVAGVLRGNPRELLDMMRDTSSSSTSHSAFDAIDDAALLGTLHAAWAVACSPSLKRALETDLLAAGLPRVAIEVDGPTHWASNCNAALGRTQTRNRLLVARKWRVVTVASHEWDELETGAQKAAYVALRLRQAGVPVSQFRAVSQPDEG